MPLSLALGFPRPADRIRQIARILNCNELSPQLSCRQQRRCRKAQLADRPRAGLAAKTRRAHPDRHPCWLWAVRPWRRGGAAHRRVHKGRAAGHCRPEPLAGRLLCRCAGGEYRGRASLLPRIASISGAASSSAGFSDRERETSRRRLCPARRDARHIRRRASA